VAHPTRRTIVGLLPAAEHVSSPDMARALAEREQLLEDRRPCSRFDGTIRTASMARRTWSTAARPQACSGLGQVPRDRCRVPRDDACSRQHPLPRA
jgi:hypothetical protein